MEQPDNCGWHFEIQSRLSEIKNLVTNHQPQELTNEQLKRNDELIKKFVLFIKEGKGKYQNK